MASTDDLDHPFTIGDGPRLASPPKTVVGIAAIAIVAMGGLGLARGIMLSRPASSDASPLAVLTGLAPAASAAAKPATILPRDDSWSTLSGPRMLDASEKPKPEAKVAASDDDADDSTSPAEQTAAADAIVPDAPDAAPAAPAASSNAVPAAPTSPPPAPPPN
jgi:hypothetical protein